MSAMYLWCLYCRDCVVSPIAILISCLSLLSLPVSLATCIWVLYFMIYFFKLLRAVGDLNVFMGQLLKKTLNQPPILYPELFASTSADGEI